MTAALQANTGRFLLLGLIAALLAAMPFLPGLPGEFVFDDIPNIVNNRSIHMTELSASSVVDVLATKQVSGNMRGLPTLTFALDYWRAGGVADPASFKITNIAIHALTAFVLACFFRILLLVVGVSPVRAQWLALALALAWAVHPLQVSSVLYTVQRLQTLGTLFVVLALLAYLWARREQMSGRSGRTGLLIAVLLWVAAMNCKEDSVLFPAYALALELTVLRFAATDAVVARWWRRLYLAAVLAGAAIYVLWVLPHYWTWDAYAGRDFNSAERLLTQARVLCLYMWQIVLPLPQHMPFYYDWIQPSRGLMHPWTTLPAFGLITALLVLAWRARNNQPLLALGVLLYFGAHFIASNVIGLELAYEHRNHFALVGAVLAVGSVLAHVGRRLQISITIQASVCGALLLLLASSAVMRAHDWRSNVTLAKASTVAATKSPRAWIELCDAHVKAGGGAVKDNPHLDAAIEACASGADAVPDTLNSLALLVVLKTVRGDITAQDWQRFQNRLGTARMSWDNTRAPLILTYYASLGVALNKSEVLTALARLDARVKLSPSRLAYIGDAVMNQFSEPDLAMPYFLKAIQAAPPGDPYAWDLRDELRSKGRGDLAAVIEQAGVTRLNSPAVAPNAPTPD